MPLIKYHCTCGLSSSKFFREPKESPALIICEKCGKEAKRILGIPSSQSLISVDNGTQARAVEVNLEIIEDIKERSTKDFTKKD